MKKAQKPITPYDPMTGRYPAAIRNELAHLIEDIQTPADLEKATKATCRFKTAQRPEFYHKRDALAAKIRNLSADDLGFILDVDAALAWLKPSSGYDYSTIERDMVRRLEKKRKRLREPVIAETPAD